jgi:hypothetical protein
MKEFLMVHLSITKINIVIITENYVEKQTI